MFQFCDWCGDQLEDSGVEVFNKDTTHFEAVCYKCFHEASIESDNPRKRNLCMDCRHAEFDGDNNPYCSLTEGVWEITSDVESCELYDPIPLEFRYDKKTPVKSDIKRIKP